MATRAQELFSDYLFRSVRLGLEATGLTLVALLIYPFLPGDFEGEVMSYGILLVACALGVLIVALLPWRRLFASGTGMRWLYAWSVLDIILITFGVIITGQSTSELWIVYALTTIFFAMSYPPVGQTGLLAFTIAAYSGAVMADSDLDQGRLFMRIAIIGVLATLASFMSRELKLNMSVAVEAQQESEHRAELLAVVAGAAREMSSLGHEDVLDAVVDATLALGFEACSLSLLDAGGETYTAVRGRNVPEEHLGSPHPLSSGVTGLAVERGETVVLDDYASHPSAMEWFKQQGFRSVVAAPIVCEGQISAVLVAGTRNVRRIAAEDVESVELLAAQTGRVLENIRRFEAEHEMVERLAELDRLKSDFLSMISHELRTPLTTIEGMGLTLHRRWEELDESVRRDFLGRITSNAKTLEEIVSKLLDFSRLESGTFEVVKERFDLSEVIAHVVHRFGADLLDHRLDVAVVGRMVVNADRMLIERVLDNLISNATKYTPAGTRISVAAQSRDGRVFVRIADDGPGIAEDELSRIGERFFRGGDLNSRAIRGTGLGVALVKQILEMHGAELNIESRVGKGSSFSFDLPLAGIEASV